MLIPHLLFGHFVGDYLLQTDWIAIRKVQSFDGLLLHVLIVAVASAIAISPYLSLVWLPFTLLMLLHLAQDRLKTWLGRRLRWHLAWLYFLDQASHIAMIIAFQLWLDHKGIAPETSSIEQFLLALGAALIVVTRFYEVSWWANWFDMIVYMARWQRWGYLERATMLIMATLGAAGTVLALSFSLPRLYWSWRRGQALWRQRYGLLEWCLGILLSIAIGYGLLHPMIP